MIGLKGRRVFVTGGAGFIGSHICEKLVREGAAVVVFDDFSTGKASNLAAIRDEIDIVTGKVENYEDVSQAIRGCDSVIHEAFPYGKSGMGLEQQYVETGVIGTFNVLKASVRGRVEKVVNVSTVSAYGVTSSFPLHESDPIDPFLPYGVTKYAGELYCKSFSKLYALDTVSLRYFHVFGPRYAQFDHSAMVNFLYRATDGKPLLVFGDGSQLRDYTYIDNVVDGTLLALTKKSIYGETYNISGGESITIAQLAKEVVEIVNQNVEIRLAKPGEYMYSDEFCTIPVGLTRRIGDSWIDERNYVGDISKAERDLGYTPRISLKEGIRRTANWIKAKGIQGHEKESRNCHGL